MPKRVATKELNHENWDEEDEEDEGVGIESFKAATPEVMKQRVIKVGKRRITGGSAVSPFAASKAFANFTGFTPTSDAKPSLGFLTAKPSGNTTKPLGAFTLAPIETKSSASEDKTTEDPSLVYLSKLKTLNEDVVEWIQSKVKENPTCILTPIFDDYKNHHKELVSERDKASSASSSGSSSSVAPPKQFASGFFADLNSKPSFSFGANSGSGFFNNLAKPPEQPDNKEDDESEEPQKNEFKRVEEEDAVYTQRVKVYAKKDKDFVERGVGMLYIKEVKKDDTIKYQLIVRADTNLGNLLVNVLLADSIPSSRRGKNNVNLICLPTPEDKAVTQLLLRVKTEADADKLHEEILKFKKGK